MSATRAPTLAVACAAAMACGCATAAKRSLQPLPAAEQQAFWRCEPYAWARSLQQSPGEPAYRTEFAAAIAGYYARLPDEAARHAFLAENGCPPDAVAGPSAPRE